MNYLVRICLIIGLIVSGATVFLDAQDVLLEVDFQDNTLGGLISIDNDGNVISSEFQGFDPGFGVEAISGPNDKRAIGVSTFESGATADNWLVTPAIQINRQATTLTWEAVSLSGDVNQLESYKVLVSTSGQSVGDFTGELLRINGEESEVTHRSVDLSAYLGQTIYLAFNQTTTAGYALAIDNIKVEQPAADTQADILRISGNRYQDIGDLDLAMVVSNTGSETITSVTITGSINGMAGSFPFTDLNIAPGGVDNLNFSDLFPFEADHYVIEGRITEINGQPYDGELKREDRYLVQDPPLRKFVMEESTSTQCGACPLGFVQKQIMELKYPNEFIGISVHNNDPMSNFVYGLGLQSIEGYIGEPSAAINREIFFDVDEVEQYLVDEFSIVAPVSISMDQTFDPMTRQLVVELESVSHTRINQEQLRYSVIIVEDNVSGTDPLFAQANDFSSQSLDIRLEGLDGVNWNERMDPVPQQEMVYDDVARDIIGGFPGIPQSISALELNERTTFQLDYSVSSVFDENEMYVVAMAIDVETGMIVAAVEEKMMVLSDVHDLSLTAEVNIFPNPVSDLLQIQIASEDQVPMDMKVYSVDGQCLVSRRIDTKGGQLTESIEVSDWPSGTYYLRIGQDNSSLFKKIVVNRTN